MGGERRQEGREDECRRDGGVKGGMKDGREVGEDE